MEDLKGICRLCLEETDSQSICPSCKEYLDKKFNTLVTEVCGDYGFELSERLIKKIIVDYLLSKAKISIEIPR